jgi:hypothetical protein
LALPWEIHVVFSTVESNETAFVIGTMMIYGQTGCLLGFGLELVNDTCGDCPLSPSQSRGVADEDFAVSLPANHSSIQIRKLKED